MLLYHRQTGSASSHVPLVLLHGLLGSSRNWQSTASELGLDRTVFSLDLRNHGQSPHADSADYLSMVGDVLEWLDQAQLPRAHWVGHSMGGKVAMLLAARYPDRVASLGVVDIAPRDYHSMSHRAEFAAMNELDLRALASRAEAELKFEARVADWAMRKFLVTNLERNASGDGWRWTVNLPVLTASLPTLEANSLAPDDSYSGPTHFWRGEKSNYIRAEDHAAIRAYFPSATITTLPGAAHNPHMEARPAFVAAVRASLIGLP